MPDAKSLVPGTNVKDPPQQGNGVTAATGARVELKAAASPEPAPATPTSK